MGKLGGYELNVSSDIDLIFAMRRMVKRASVMKISAACQITNILAAWGKTYCSDSGNYRRWI